MSFFITFEGGEGSGKSTQARLLVERLRKQKKSGVSYFEEPGTTILGRQVREWLSSPERPLVVSPGSDTQLPLIDSHNGYSPPAIHLHADSPRAELLAFTIARSQLVEEFIIPRLKGKNIIIGDRYADSTFAYQGYGRNLDLKLVKIANEIATQGIKPNLTFFFDIPPEKGLARKFGNSRQTFEKEELVFHDRVREGYLELVKEEPDRWFVIDSTQNISEISIIVWNTVKQLLAEKVL